jgi:uncharacterized integral membrane protein
MPEPAQPQRGTTRTLPAPSANGSSPLPAPPGPVPKPRRLSTRISSLRIGLIAGLAALIVVLIFVIQNGHAVNVSFLGAHLRVSLAVALLLAAVAGALIMAAAGTARITQLRRIMRRARQQPRSG